MQDGSWILLLEALVALSLFVFIIWWTWPRPEAENRKHGVSHQNLPADDIQTAQGSSPTTSRSESGSENAPASHASNLGTAATLLAGGAVAAALLSHDNQQDSHSEPYGNSDNSSSDSGGGDSGGGSSGE